MARTPTDPTKAQVWITKGLDDLDFEFYFPQGPKGDPGGITLGTDLPDTSLNNYITSGVYRQTNPGFVTALNNYPIVGSGGILTVHQRDAGSSVVLQTFQMTSGAIDTRVFWQRVRVSGTWSAWRAFNSTRIDQTAGRAIYQWDDINSREQLIYGDTGWRDVTAAVSGGSAGTLYLRRANSQVSLQMAGFQMTTASPNGTAVSNLPVGFRPSHNSYYPMIHGASRNSRSFYMGANGSGGFNNANADENYTSLLQWTTVDAWPTVLPGSAFTGIPNI